MIMDMALQNGYLYCGYYKTETDDNFTIVRVKTTGEDFSEYQLSGEYGGWLLFGKDRVYSRNFASNGELVFYVYYFETGETKELYRTPDYFLQDYCTQNDKLLLLLSDKTETTLTVLGIDKDGNTTNYGDFEGRRGSLFSGTATYLSIGTTLYQFNEKDRSWNAVENLPLEGINPFSISLYREEGDLLYYIVGADLPEEGVGSNTFLMQYNTSNGESKRLRAYYTP